MKRAGIRVIVDDAGNKTVRIKPECRVVVNEEGEEFVVELHEKFFSMRPRYGRKTNAVDVDWYGAYQRQLIKNGQKHKRKKRVTRGMWLG